MSKQQNLPEKFSLHTVFQRLLIYDNPRMPISETISILGDILSEAGIAKVITDDAIKFGDKYILHNSAGNKQARAFIYRTNEDSSRSNNGIRQAIVDKLELCFIYPEWYDYVNALAIAVHNVLEPV